MVEIRVRTENPKRILSLVGGFSSKRRKSSQPQNEYWEEPIGMNVGGENPGTDRKLEENIKFGWGILIARKITPGATH